ncbi:Mitochondrial escape protein 2 [Escovopsis weberi]|uniref:Mitochondrial escape protein 2 n=1 Tax=Escovopsis weberi TaxID=150374 RepID=A0A0M9VWJ5_ESCWE|nr:Mitochondrial escape protein 2 [Escovopsis weberi]
MLPVRGLGFWASRPALRNRPIASRAWPARAVAATTIPSNGGGGAVRLGLLGQDVAAVSREEKAQEQEMGKFHVGPGEAILFFDNIFPPKLAFLLGRRAETNRRLTELLGRYDGSALAFLDPIRLVRRAIPESLPIKATEIVPRLQDGGAYVKFHHDTSLHPDEIEASLLKQLRDQPIKPWFNPLTGVRARLIRGTPWLEDLYRYPTSLVQVEFMPPVPGTSPEDIPEEIIYSLFRRYGRIADIFLQPSDSKVTPRFVNVAFSSVRDAIMARNCMHGYVLGEAEGGGKNGTKLRLSYIRRAKPHSVWNWITSHPRIIIPVVAALLAGLSVIVFDPIRQLFIRVHVQQSLRLSSWKVFRWLRSRAGFSLAPKHNLHIQETAHSGSDTVWKHRQESIEQLQSWLDGGSGSFIVVTGPRGSGKREIVMDQALAGRRNVLYVDCKPIIDAGGDATTIKRLAAAMGYWPVFSWANGISSMIDLALQSTTGVKSGFTETLDTQVQSILTTTAQALKRIALSGRSKLDKDAAAPEDSYLEAHPETRPVIVIDNFLDKNEETALLYDKLAEWAATMVQNNIAHVVFLTNQSSYNKPLSKAMPDRVSRTISFRDLDKDLARNFVISRLEELWKREVQESQEDGDGDDGDVEAAPKQPAKRPDLSGLDACIQTLGGRLTDLEFLARRLNSGQNPREATEEIVNENATDIVKIFLLGKTAEAAGRRWSTQQAWYLIKALAESEDLRYNQVLLQPTFAASTTAAAGSGEAAIEGLASTELIAIQTHRGRPQRVRPGKALHKASFKVLLQDRVLRARMDLGVLEEVASVEARKLAALEAELQLLGGLPRHTGETSGRVMYLLNKLDAGQRRIEGMEKEMKLLEKILDEEY